MENPQENPADDTDESLWVAFQRFHCNNPAVYTALVRFARQWVSRTGRHRLGIAALYERVRWELAITTDDPDYKLSNNHRAFYARLIMRHEKELDGLFVLRPSKADEWIGKALDNNVIKLTDVYQWELERVSKTEIRLRNRAHTIATRYPFTYEGTLKAKEAAGGKRIKIEPRLKKWIRDETLRRHRSRAMGA